MWGHTRFFRTFRLVWIVRLIFIAFCLAFLSACQGSSSDKSLGIPTNTQPVEQFSLEQCAVQLLQEKYSSRPDIMIVSATADEVRAASDDDLSCEGAERDCRPGVATVMCGGLHIDLVIRRNGSQCKVVDEKSYLWDGKVMCPTSQPTVTPEPTITPTPEPIHIVGNQILYRVQPGDTLATIAEKLNVTLEELISSNDLDPGSQNIPVGETLTISCPYPNSSCTCRLPGPHTNMPAYYRPHPALSWVASIPPRHFPSMRWIDDVHFAISRPSQGDFRCRIEPWDVYELPDTSSKNIEPQTVFTETIGCTTPTPPPDIASLYKIKGELVDWITAPDGQKALVWVKTDKPIAKLRLGEASEPNEGLYDEIWPVDTEAQKARSLFYTSIGYFYEWASNSRFLVMTWDCGNSDPASPGAYISFDTQTLKSYLIEKEYEDNCGEYWGPGIDIHADYLFYDGSIMTLQGTQRFGICTEDEFAIAGPWSQDGQSFYLLCDGKEDNPTVLRWFDAQAKDNNAFKLCDAGESPRTFTWSQDKLSFYVSCGAKEGNRSDVLRRYDTQTGQVHSLTDPAEVTYKAKEIILSPDQSHLLFLWGGGNYSPHPLSFLANEEPCGIWLLDLTKLGD